MKKKQKSLLENHESVNFFVYISPWLIGFLAFIFFPMLYSLFLSFTSSTIGKMGAFIGFENYYYVFTDPLFKTAVINTLYFSILGVPLQLILAFFLASLLNMKLKGMGIFRTIFYLPSVVAGISTVLLWSWIFNANYGLINYLLSIAGLKGPNWLTDPRWSIPAIIIMSLHAVGGQMLIFLAALQDIPNELYESAKMDGVGLVRMLFKIKLPMISPTLFFLILGIIGSFQVFMQPYIFANLNANMGRNRGMYVYVQYLFDNAFRYYQAGYGSAIAWILFIATLFLTLIIMKSSNRWVYYGGGN